MAYDPKPQTYGIPSQEHVVTHTEPAEAHLHAASKPAESKPTPKAEPKKSEREWVLTVKGVHAARGDSEVVERRFADDLRVFLGRAHARIAGLKITDATFNGVHVDETIDVPDAPVVHAPAHVAPVTVGHSVEHGRPDL